MWDMDTLKSNYGIHGIIADDIIISVVSRRSGSGVIVSEVVMGPAGVEIPTNMDVKHNWAMVI